MPTGNTPWPNLLADLKAKREALDQMIALVATHFVGETPGEMPASPNPEHHAPERRKAKPARPASGTDDEQILQQLRAAGEPVRPRDLAKAMRITIDRLRRRLEPLLKQKLIVVTGKTAGRRISLPGKSTARASDKEGP